MRFLESSFQEILNQYELTPEQLMYTKHQIECLQLSKEDTERVEVVLTEENGIVNFFVLHKNGGVVPYSDNKNALLLRSFSTATKEQRKGFAKKPLTLLPNFVRQHYPGINEIVLAVKIQNEAAQALYKKCNFIDRGERRMGKKGELIILSYQLSFKSSI